MKPKPKKCTHCVDGHTKFSGYDCEHCEGTGFIINEFEILTAKDFYPKRDVKCQQK